MNLQNPSTSSLCRRIGEVYFKRQTGFHLVNLTAKGLLKLQAFNKTYAGSIYSSLLLKLNQQLRRLRGQNGLHYRRTGG